MKAKSIKGKSTAEIKTALEQSMADGFKPTLAICFISKSQDRKAISNYWMQQVSPFLAALPTASSLMKKQKKVQQLFCCSI